MPSTNDESRDWKHTLANTPALGPVLRRAYWAFQKLRFSHSADYWETRYKSGRDSGAGSYGRLSVFKAETLNAFVAENHIQTVVELGCGDGHQLSLANYPDYLGMDISSEAISICNARFQNDSTKIFRLMDESTEASRSSDLALSLDVVYHLVEDDVFESYMQRLFDISRRFVIVFASNEDRHTASPHVRHRCFTDWIAANAPEWMEREMIPNLYPFDPNNPDQTSFADFHIFERSQGSSGSH